jgi:hypothetical protein
MIKLSISAGHTWTVNEDNGALQPTVESLGMPAETAAKLERWQNRWLADYEVPEFIGRKDYEAQGRDIAEELQKTVGARFHVVFRHWVNFDSRRWQTLWREEDLFSGEQKEFWLEDFLPDDVVGKVVFIYPDFGGAYLWDLDGSCIGNEGPDFSDTLDARFTEWAEQWEACYDIHDMASSKARLAEKGFDEQGLVLAAELKRAISDAARVIYCCALRKVKVELLEDDTTIEWPEDTDFRQWALDHRGN